MTDTIGLNGASTAVVLVDLQNDFIHAGGAYARAGLVSSAIGLLPTTLDPLVSAVARQGGLIAASRFTLWPNARGEPMISPHLQRLRPFLSRGDFAPGSWGHSVVDPLAERIRVCVDKVAYSAFFNTQLDWILRRAGIDTLVIGGIVTQGGVASTMRDAHMRDYRTIILADGCASLDQRAHEASLADMRSLAQVMSCNELLALLDGPDQ